MKIPDLTSFPESSRTKVSRIEELFDRITCLKKEGISYQDIATKLTNEGMQITSQELTSMLGRIRRKKKAVSSMNGISGKASPVNNLPVASSISLPNSEVIDAQQEETRPYAHQKDGKLIADEVW